VSMTAPVIVTDDRATVSCPATLLAPGASLTCSASYPVTQADLNAGAVVNTASASSGTTTSPVDSAAALTAQAPQLHLDKSASPTTYDHVGQQITYTYLITNDSEATLNGPFTVTDDKTTVSCPPTGSRVRGTTVTCTAIYSITQADLDAGSITNHATAHAFYAGNPMSSNTDSATVEADKNPALSIDKSVTPGTYDHTGQVLNYSYTVTNTGNVTMTAPVTVTDDRATVSCPATILAPGASLT